MSNLNEYYDHLTEEMNMHSGLALEKILKETKMEPTIESIYKLHFDNGISMEEIFDSYYFSDDDYRLVDSTITAGTHGLGTQISYWHNIDIINFIYDNEEIVEKYTGLNRKIVEETIIQLVKDNEDFIYDYPEFIEPILDTMTQEEIAEIFLEKNNELGNEFKREVYNNMEFEDLKYELLRDL